MQSRLLYENAAKGTGTSRGVSYWQVASMCGRQRNLIQIHREVADALGESDNKTVGSFYHWLQEQWALGNIQTDQAVDVGDIVDPEWSEAIRLFDFYRQIRPLDYFGKIIGSEVKLPVDDTHKACISLFMGMHIEDPDLPTGQADRLVYMDANDVDRIESNHELVLRGPGLYIHDHKTSGQRKSESSIRADWTDTVQALAYPVLYNVGPAYLGKVKGFLVDGIVKHKNLDPLKSLQVGFAPYSEDNDDIVRAAILEAKYQRDRNVANPFACYSKFGTPCAFLENGLCERK